MEQQVKRYMATVKIGPKGQIVIPKEIRDMFELETGESLIIMADSSRGIALQKQQLLQAFSDAVFNGSSDSAKNDANEKHYANAIKKTLKEGNCEE